jgi:hypothetical protein
MQDAIYIRHNFSPYEILEDLWQRRLIAVRYENIPSTNPEDYEKKSDKDAIRRFNRYGEEGVMVGAAYRAIRPSEMLVGEIEPGTPIEIEDYGGLYAHKTLQLVNTQVISYLDYPVLAATQPRQGTVTGWPSAKHQLAHILEHERLILSVQSLAPSQLEVLCQEYLRSTGKLSALVLPIGGSLIDVDIVGVNKDEEPVIAQVTHSSNCQEVARKLGSLQTWTTQTRITPHRYFFGPKSCLRQNTGVEYLAIEDVFDEMKDSHFLRQMLGQ